MTTATRTPSIPSSISSSSHAHADHDRAVALDGVASFAWLDPHAVDLEELAFPSMRAALIAVPRFTTDLSAMTYTVGIDLGGTQIKAAAFGPDGELLHRETNPTRDGERVEDVPAWADTIRRLLEVVDDALWRGACPYRAGGAGASRQRRAIDPVDARPHGRPGRLRLGPLSRAVRWRAGAQRRARGAARRGLEGRGTRARRRGAADAWDRRGRRRYSPTAA